MAALSGRKEEEEFPSAVSSLSLFVAPASRLSALECNLQPCPTTSHPYIHASLYFLEGQIVGSEIWLACFPCDIRPLSFTQPRAQRSFSAAGFRHQQLSFSRPVVCATCAHRHVALKKRGMRESYSSGKFTSSGRDLEH